MSKKIYFTFGGLVIIGLIMTYLNFQHATNCTNETNEDEVKLYIEALNQRLLQAESQNTRNALLLDKLIDHVQKKLYSIEEDELKELHSLSEEVAIRTSLKLIQQPLPPMPDYSINPSYKDGQELADVVDDILSSVKVDTSETTLDDINKVLDGNMVQYADNSLDDSVKDMIEEEKKSIASMTISDSEAVTRCANWKKEYHVEPGVSWGTLPFDLQEKWIQYSCDYHI